MNELLLNDADTITLVVFGTFKSTDKEDVASL